VTWLSPIRRRSATRTDERHDVTATTASRLSLTLRARAAIVWAAIALVLAGSVAASAYEVTKQHLVAEREAGATARAYLDARALRNAVRVSDADVTDVLSGLTTNADATVLADVHGEWFTSSAGVGPASLPVAITDAARSGRAAHQRVAIDDTVHVVVAVPVPAVDTRYYEIVSLGDIDRILTELSRRLAIAGIAAAIIAAAVGWYASGRVLRPLRRLATAAEEIADGRLDARLAPSPDRDLRTIERAFNRMAESIQQRIDRENRFSSDVTHELRSPVTAMLAALSVARRARRRNGDIDDLLDTVEERAKLLHRTVEDLLEISRVEAGVATLQLSPVDPLALVRAVLERSGESGATIDGDGPIAPVELDKRRVGQILQNLIDNANRYGGGVARVRVAEVDGCIRFAVEDHGPGVADVERTRIFERFARGEAARASGASGTGLGLSLVAEHAALHGGSVRLEDAPTGGARFVIDLPARRPW
jgi:signal transduction histidine kinase